MKKDVGEHIAREANSYQKGAEEGFGEVMKLVRFKIDDCFDSFKRTLHVEEESFGAEGANSYYEVMWKLIRPHWGKLFKGKQELMDIRTINRRLAKWSCFDMVLDLASRKGDWTHSDMNRSKVYRSLLIITQLFESRFEATMPADLFQVQLLAWTRLCYPNKEDTANIHWEPEHGLICLNNIERIAIAQAVLTSDMSDSLIYKNDELKAIKVAAPKKKQGRQARQRGKKADQETTERKEKNMCATEKMNLMIQIKEGESKAKLWPEDNCTAFRAAIPSTEDSTNVDQHLGSVQLVMSNWAMLLAENPHRKFTWLEEVYTDYSKLRSAAKLWLAKESMSVIVKEAADNATNQITGMAKYDGDENADLPKWKLILQDATQVVTILNFVKQYKTIKLEVASWPVVRELKEFMMDRRPNIDEKLERIFNSIDAVCNHAMRYVACALPAEIHNNSGKMPDAVADMFTSQDDVMFVAHFRANATKQLLSYAPQIDSTILENLLPLKDDVNGVDAVIEELELWQRVWKWMCAKASTDDVGEELAGRLGSIRVMLNPEFMSKDVEEEEEEKEEGAEKSTASTGFILFVLSKNWLLCCRLAEIKQVKQRQ